MPISTASRLYTTSSTLPSLSSLCSSSITSPKASRCGRSLIASLPAQPLSARIPAPPQSQRSASRPAGRCQPSGATSSLCPAVLAWVTLTLHAGNDPVASISVHRTFQRSILHLHTSFSMQAARHVDAALLLLTGWLVVRRVLASGLVRAYHHPPDHWGLASHAHQSAASPCS